jgi:hypothetical protein
MVLFFNQFDLKIQIGRISSVKLKWDQKRKPTNWKWYSLDPEVGNSNFVSKFYFSFKVK